MMKNIILILTLLSYSIFLFGQEQEDLFFLETDSTWQKEIFHFPLGFAQDINYEGIEDARFPVGWSKKDSSTFWSYVFAWKINVDKELREDELEFNLQLYFDGLMGGKIGRDKEIVMQKTIALFLKKDGAKDTSSFIGKIKTFDAFFTKKPMTLNVMAEQYFCKQEKKSIILFKFSPKDFESKVWLKLEEAKLPTKVCNH